MGLGVFDIDQTACVRHTDLLAAKGQLRFRRQVEQSQIVCNRGTVLAHLLTQLLVRQLALLNECVIREGNLHCIEVLALDILHQRHLHHLRVGGYADIGRNVFKTCHLGGFQASLASYELVFAVRHLSDSDRSNDSLLFNRLRQFLKRLLVELLAWLERVGLYTIERNGCNGGGKVALAHSGIDVHIGQNRTKSASQSCCFFLCSHNCSLSTLGFQLSVLPIPLRRSISLARLR